MRALRVVQLVIVIGMVAVLVNGPSLRPSAVAADPRPVAEVTPDLGPGLTATLASVGAAMDRFPTVVPGTPCLSTAKACIDLSARQTWLLSGGKIAYGPVPITSGRPGWRTPPGTFRVSFKNIAHRSSIFNNAPMPYSVFFNGGIAFHQGSLRELSHGCIHLSRAAAQTYFATLKRGDIVQVTP